MSPSVPVASAPSGFARIPVGIDDDRRGRVRRANRRLAILMAGLAALLMLGATWMYHNTVREAKGEALRRLATFNMLRHDAVHAFFRTHENEIQVWAENREFEERAREIFEDWERLSAREKRGIREHLVNAVPLPAPTAAQRTYLDHYRRITPTLQSFIDHHGFYDLFLFTNGGELAYTVVREDDFGLDYTDASNPYYASGLGRVAREAALLSVRSNVEAGEELPTAVSDFEPYRPSGGSMEAFIAEPLPDAGSGEKLGVMAIQLSFAELNSILDYNSGLGESGRTLLVGSDLRIRNDLADLGLEGDKGVELDTTAVRRALEGERYLGRSTGEQGQPVYVASQPLVFHDIRWAVLTEMDRSEVREPLRVYLWVWLAALLGIALLCAAMYQILRLRR